VHGGYPEPPKVPLFCRNSSSEMLKTTKVPVWPLSDKAIGITILRQLATCPAGVRSALTDIFAMHPALNRDQVQAWLEKHCYPLAPNGLVIRDTDGCYFLTHSGYSQHFVHPPAEYCHIICTTIAERDSRGVTPAKFEAVSGYVDEGDRAISFTKDLGYIKKMQGSKDSYKLTASGDDLVRYFNDSSAVWTTDLQLKNIFHRVAPSLVAAGAKGVPFELRAVSGMSMPLNRTLWLIAAVSHGWCVVKPSSIAITKKGKAHWKALQDFAAPKGPRPKMEILDI